jgi:serine/threonine-protein kinase
MGNVFLGVYGTPSDERLCVIKRLIPETLTDSERRARFSREADIARRLSHGAIAKTLAVDEVEGEPYIVQEYLEGRTLAQVLAAAQGLGQPLPLAIAIHVVREMARALAYAHGLDGGGVVHRDVAPENIMLTFAGEVRLIDFGIARAPTDPSLTEPGIVVGRQSYTAPELLRGAMADNRADIYSLGVVLWELLAGRPLMLGEMGKAPAPSSLPTALDIPAELDAVVLRAVAAKVEDRFQSVEDLHGALGPFVPAGFFGEKVLSAFIRACYDVDTERAHLSEALAEARPLLDDRAAGPRHTEQETSPRPPRTRRWRWTLALLGGLGGLVSAGVVLRPRQPAPPAAPVRAIESPPSPLLPPPAPAPLAPPISAVAPAAHSSAPSAASVVKTPSRPPARRPPNGLGAGALLDRARDSFQVGDVDAAERDARSVLQTNGTALQKARAYVILGQVQVLGGRRAGAETSFAAALQLDPSNDAASAALARLRRRSGGVER